MTKSHSRAGFFTRLLSSAGVTAEPGDPKPLCGIHTSPGTRPLDFASARRSNNRRVSGVQASMSRLKALLDRPRERHRAGQNENRPPAHQAWLRAVARAGPAIYPGSAPRSGAGRAHRGVRRAPSQGAHGHRPPRGRECELRDSHEVLVHHTRAKNQPTRLHAQSARDERERLHRSTIEPLQAVHQQTSSRSSAISKSRLNMVRPTRKRSGARAGVSPKAVRSASA